VSDENKNPALNTKEDDTQGQSSLENKIPELPEKSNLAENS
jgi:hypothetical protein